MAALSLAIIGKNNEPLYIKEFFDDSNGARIDLLSEEELFGLPVPAAETIGTDDATSDQQKQHQDTSVDCASLRQQFILHAALDRFIELAGPPPGYRWRKQGVTGADAMFVGLLCPVEDMRVYGYMTTTLVKFLLTVEDEVMGVADQQAVDETIKKLFIKIHSIYVEHTLNPFSKLSEKRIVSKRFDAKVKECVTAYNRNSAFGR